MMMAHKKNVDSLRRLRFSGIGKHHCNHIRVKAHVVTDVSVWLFTLGCFFHFADFEKQEYKTNAMLFFILSVCELCYIGRCGLYIIIVVCLIAAAKVVKDYRTYKQ